MRAGNRDSPERGVAEIASLRFADSPRLNGEDPQHIARIAEIQTELPPIIVKRSNMQVIDGMHRLRAALANGKSTVAVEFFDGSDEEAFLLAVRSNVGHGLPLSLADRIAAVERIVAAQPELSDRFIAESAGLAPSTIATIRRRATEGFEQLASRLGKDGKIRPVDGSLGRLKAAEVLRSRPNSSLREVARAVGISPSTVRDVRNRLSRGDDPIPRANGDAPKHPPDRAPAVLSTQTAPEELLRQLGRDPSLRQTDKGRQFVCALWDLAAATASNLPTLSNSVPPHARPTVATLLRHFAGTLRVIADDFDPKGAS